MVVFLFTFFHQKHTMAEKIYVKDILECQQSNVRMIKQATWSIIRSSKWRERNILLCQSIVKIRISTTIQNVYGLYMCNMYVLPYHLGRVCFCEKPLQQQKVTKLGTINARSESNCMALQQNDSRSQNAFEHPLLHVIICKKSFRNDLSLQPFEWNFSSSWERCSSSQVEK